VLLIALTLCAGAGSARPPVSAHTVLGEWATDGSVAGAAIDAARGIAYIGGSFDHIGAPTGAGIVVDAASGAIDRHWPTVALGFEHTDEGDGVRAVVGDGRGGWFVAGRFRSVAGVRRHGLAHILPSGKLDSSFAPRVTGGEATTLARSDSLLLVAGTFTKIDGVPRGWLAAFDLATGALSSWTARWRVVPDFEDVFRSANPLVVSGDTVYLGSHRFGVSRFDLATGEERPWAVEPYIGDPIVALSVVDGVMVAATEFHLTVFDAASGAQRWDVRIASAQRVIAGAYVAAGAVWLAGNFGVDGTTHTLAGFDAATGRILGGTPEPPGPLTALVSTPEWALLAGTHGVYRFDGAQVRALGAAGGFDGAPRALGVNGRRVYVGGDFTFAGGAARHDLAAIDIRTRRLLPWAPKPRGHVTALTFVAGRLIVGTAVRVPHSETVEDASDEVSAYRPPSTRRLWLRRTDGEVGALTATRGRVFVGGTFMMIGHEGRTLVAQLDVRNGRVLPWRAAGLAGYGVSGIGFTRTKVFVGGSFEANVVAAYDARTGKRRPFVDVPLEGDPQNPNGSEYSYVETLTAADGAVWFNGTMVIDGTYVTRARADAENGTWRGIACESNETGGRLAATARTVYALTYDDRWTCSGTRATGDVAAFDARSGRLMRLFLLGRDRRRHVVLARVGSDVLVAAGFAPAAATLR
jgi:hypothetical protein